MWMTNKILQIQGSD